MKFKALMMTMLALTSVSALAAYDNTWYVTEFWSGEYPNGVAVVEAGVRVPARASIDKDLAPSMNCELPQKAVYSPWNAKRPAQYFSATKIVPLTAKEDFEYAVDEGTLKIRKGDVIEYIVYYAEGGFGIRYKGVEYYASQDFFDYVTYDEALLNVRPDEWLHITCVGGEDAWILMDDLLITDKNGDLQYLQGLDSWGLGFKEYGVVEDLP